jgi:DNA-binding CsgD family transcriptional regulator
MVIADDERRYVAANGAACLLLRLPEEAILELSIEDLVSARDRSLVAELWDSFLREGTQKGTVELAMLDGALVEVEYSATAHIEPGRHLAIWMFPPGHFEESAPERTQMRRVLTAREREVLAMVAMGMGSSWIAATLGVAPSTVDNHMRHCLQKLGARNRAHAIVLGLVIGEIWLDLDAPM